MERFAGAEKSCVVGESPALWGAKRAIKELYERMRPHRFTRSIQETMETAGGKAEFPARS